MLTDKQIIYQLKERLENTEQQSKEWQALANIYAEGKDLLRRELDQAERGKKLGDSCYMFADVIDMGLDLIVKAQDSGLIFDLVIPGTNAVVWTTSIHIGDIDLEVE